MESACVGVARAWGTSEGDVYTKALGVAVAAVVVVVPAAPTVAAAAATAAATAA